MISKLHIENFRSIEKAEVDLGRITVLTGSNNSGKSSLMYGLLTLKTIYWNSNQPLNTIFNSPIGINLGGFNDVVFNNELSREIGIGVTLQNRENQLSNYFLINRYAEIKTNLSIESPFKHSSDYNFVLPYDLIKRPNAITTHLHYNGLYIESYGPSSYQNLAYSLNSFANSIVFMPTRRGFTKPSFVNVPISYFSTSEDEIATEIEANNLQAKLSHYLEIIANRTLQLSRLSGSGVILLETTNTQTGFTTNIVNEGTGTNQLVMILAQALHPQKKFICIDEPEIHLHPSMIEKLVECLVEIAYKEDKQFMLSTHSEHFVSCLLAAVSKKKLMPDDLKVYYLTKEENTTHIEHQAVNEDGQMEGGLKNFYESELKNLETFFNFA